MMPASRPPLFENGDAAETLRRHLDDRLGHPGVRGDARHAVAGVHDFPHMRQLGPELAAWMKRAEVERGEAAALEQRDRQRVAQHELHRRRGGRGFEPVGAGLRRAGIVRQTSASRPSVLLASAVIAINGMA